MCMISVHFDQVVGPVKPMHAVNNGPAHALSNVAINNHEAWRDAGIPYARNHDASLYPGYGLEHVVDISAVFPDFSADVNDPASYDFVLTDEYTEAMLDNGTKPFYRLGTKIEHWTKKYGTLPPADFRKWAEICAHIIAHYNEGWADGHRWNIEYWEIWNEPDLGPKTWGGTPEQFYDLFEITAKHLKERFPQLKIGGPALARDTEWSDAFLQEMQRRRVPMDFFSWHIYCADPAKLTARQEVLRQQLTKYGYGNAETICNEWNYTKDRKNLFVYNLEVVFSAKGAAFCTACMLTGQQSTLDMMMYYDARPGTILNGMFDFYTLGVLKGYYPFKMFNTLYRMGSSCSARADDKDIYVSAAKDAAGNSSILLCYYTDDDTVTETKTVRLDLTGGADSYDMYLLDADTDAACTGVFTGGCITLAPNTVVLLKSTGTDKGEV
ncbi:MAG: hypothetical protein IKM36_03805 [Oscillospiraceae bacterium]|nr:hypothetical protein [Oscillospiraceae bacterium]MBR2896982.1 hypothetical protein [Oscillospiraceae bacterium]MBR2977323.1 hypothetical protein [Oscillospiraceae bacterium]MBR3849602.1 hypothetical protein [Oscillospiraceae bacterium]